MQREIERQPKVPKLKEELKGLLNALCFKKDTPLKADLIFAFGTNMAPKALAGTIESLLNADFSKKVIITGGVANYRDCKENFNAESEIVFSLINSSAFPDVEFILEKESMNNLENVNYASKLIDFSKIDSIICLSHSYAAARSVQTLKNRFKGVIYSHPYDVPSEINNIQIDQSTWWLTERGKALVWGEYLRIKTYSERTDFDLTNEMIDTLMRIKFCTKIEK